MSIKYFHSINNVSLFFSSVKSNCPIRIIIYTRNRTGHGAPFNRDCLADSKMVKHTTVAQTVQKLQLLKVY
jgi:hypothetical protein